MMLLELCEALTTVLPHKIVQNTPARKQYAIAFRDTLFMVVFDIYAEKHGVVSFYEQDENNNPEFGKTGNVGYAGYVFATVLKIIKDELPNYDILAYTADGASRKRLYTTLAKKYAQSMWVYIIPTPSIEVTVLSRRELTREEKQAVVDAARDKLG